MQIAALVLVSCILAIGKEGHEQPLAMSPKHLHFQLGDHTTSVFPRLGKRIEKVSGKYAGSLLFVHI